MNEYNRAPIKTELKALHQSWLDLEKVAIRAEVNALDWARDLMNEKSLAFRFPKIALSLAQGALKISTEKKSENYSAVAKAYFQMGDRKKAISFQEQALLHKTEQDSLWELEKVLAYYNQ